MNLLFKYLHNKIKLICLSNFNVNKEALPSNKFDF